MKKIFQLFKKFSLLLLVFVSGYTLNNFSLSHAQENALPEWHIIRFLQSEEFDIAKNTAGAEPIILINPFIVPHGEEEDFIKKFSQVSDIFKNTPGFIDAKLHRSVNPQAPYTFVNVAHWKNLDAFKVAITSPEFKVIHKDFNYEGKASLYVVVKEYKG